MMKPAIRIRFCQLLALLTLAAVSAPAQNLSSAAVTPAAGVTLNGNAVRELTAVQPGDRIETAGEATLLTLSPGNELKVAPYTVLVFGKPVNLDCGIITVSSGSANVRSGGAGLTLQQGISMKAEAGLCSSGLPDAASASRGDQEPSAPTPASRRIQRSRDIAPAARGMEGNGTGWPFFAVTGVMFSSSIVAAETTQNCLHSGACSFVPDSMRSRGAMYGIGLPAATGVSYLTYRLKKKGYRWWFVPAAIVTAGNVVVASHAARYSR